ncbi:unnamed protein product [Lasius platythorax]
MEELSKAQFARLSVEEREQYLNNLLNTIEFSESEYSSNDDEDWDPIIRTLQSRTETSDNEMNVGELRDTEVEDDDDDDEDSNDEDSDENEIKIPAEGPLKAKDGTVWEQTVPVHHQTPAGSIIRKRSGPHRSTNTLSIRDTFRCFFSPEMIDVVLKCTNQKACAVYNEWNRKNPDKNQKVWKSVTSREFEAFLGILITAGANHSNTDHTTDMWKITSYPLYRATMSLNRFWNILRFIRFDDSNTRNLRLKDDKAAPIRDIWTVLNSNLRKHYRPTENLTVDEQLFPYRGRTRFTQYIPSKPAKYGIKVCWICDAENWYPLTGILYTGKSATRCEKNQGERVVKELAIPFKNSGRNITTNNFFTTLSLAKDLLSWRLTLVGTVKKNKPYVPREMGALRTRAELSTVFGFHENVTICSYMPKKNKAVILLSTMHHDKAIVGPKQKPEILHFYNKTKSDVDVMDKMLGTYTTRRQTKRWPLAFFYNIIDITALAAYLIYFMNNDMLHKRTNERRSFLRQLGEELCLPAIEDRATNALYSRHINIKTAIECMLKKSFFGAVNADDDVRLSARDHTGRTPVQGSCYICYAAPHKRRRKTRKGCHNCSRPICNEHAVNISYCRSCSNTARNT